MTNIKHLEVKSLDLIFEEYINQCRYSRGLREETVRGYEQVFKTFRTLVPEVQTLDDLSESVIDTWFKRASTRERLIGKEYKVAPIKNSSKHTYWTKMNTFFRWLVDRGILDANPCTLGNRPQKPQYEDDRAFTREETSKILGALTIANSDSLRFKRDLAMVHVLLWTGMRAGELAGLETRDIDLDKGLISIRGETSKSKEGRILELHKSARMRLQEYVDERRGHCYKTEKLWVSSQRDSGLTMHGLKHWLNRLSERSGVHVHLHRFRHTFACRFYLSGFTVGQIQKLMGHRDIKMTMGYLRSVKAQDVSKKISDIDMDAFM